MLFQPTLPHGERRYRKHYSCSERRISTHAPARGATHVQAVTGAGRLSNFNPRSRTGSDTPSGTTIWKSSLFQPTLPHGERPRSRRPFPPGTGYFNPRSRTGSDGQGRRGAREGLQISTHAPARGATVPEAQKTRNQRISTHAPARGATREPIGFQIKQRGFQPTLPHGERRRAAAARTAAHINFNPRSRTGSDRGGVHSTST